MQNFPMFIKTTDRTVVVAGSGEQAAQKCRLLVKSDADILLLGDAPEAELVAMQKHGQIRIQSGPITPESFAGATMGFIATGSPAADRCLHDLAKQTGLLVNVVDRPDLCDLITPSIVDRDPVVVAIGTEGNAPVLGRRIKAQVEQMLDPSLGKFTASVGRLRDMVAHHVPQQKRRAFWRDVFAGPAWQLFKRGAEREAIASLKDTIMGADDALKAAQLTVIDTSAGAADLIPLRAVERLQEADEIFYESPDDSAILERARRDAERHLMGGAGHDIPWPAKISISFIRRAAKPGCNVVWLKDCSEPGAMGLMQEFEATDDISFELLLAPQLAAQAKAVQEK
jgi:uroporphyrin-III C-methyltransferase/precorrin-2 dehydrogenase/sirohydrochlorin ferrochelatase